MMAFYASYDGYWPVIRVRDTYFLNNPNSNAPISEPYKVLFTGLEVIMQVPELQPICCQYR